MRNGNRQKEQHKNFFAFPESDADECDMCRDHTRPERESKINFILISCDLIKSKNRGE